MITALATTFVPDHHPTTPSTRRPAATTSSSQPSSRCFLTEGARPSFRRSVRSGGGLHRLRSHHRPWWWTSDAAGRLAASMWRPSSTNDSGSMATSWPCGPGAVQGQISGFALRRAHGNCASQLPPVARQVDEGAGRTTPRLAGQPRLDEAALPPLMEDYAFQLEFQAKIQCDNERFQASFCTFMML